MNVPRFLQERSAHAASVGWLVGTGWSTYLRFLHPSWKRSDPAQPLSWQQVAQERGLVPEMATASWYDISGQRPHRASPAHEYPQEGPDALVLPRVVASLLAAFPGAELGFAEWVGYGDVVPGRQVSGADLVGEELLGHERFTVWHGGRTLPGDGVEPNSGVRANYVWSLHGEFVVAADEDLTSTYAGVTDAVIGWDGDLEWCRVERDAPLH